MPSAADNFRLNSLATERGRQQSERAKALKAVCRKCGKSTTVWDDMTLALIKCVAKPGRFGIVKCGGELRLARR